MVKPTTGEHTRKSDAKYTGVRKRKWGKWVSEIRLPNSRERIWLGSYDTPEKAAKAFDAALFCLRGKNAKFNFPENPPEIASGSSLSRLEIQSVAARFANEADPPRKEVDNLASESPSISSVSEGGFPAEGDLTIDWSFLDFLSTQTNDYGFNIESYSGIDDVDFPGELFPALPFLPPPVVDLGDENGGSIFSDQSSLWNF